MYTLMGADSTRAHLTDTLNTIAREAKPDDDFVLILIGHGRTTAFNINSISLGLIFPPRILRRCAITFLPSAS